MAMTISSLYNKDVYTEGGKYVGKVVDALIDPDAGKVVGLLIDTRGSTYFQGPSRYKAIPFERVISVHDIILIRE